ncbi:MAG: carboxypeptidase-like regulatory domain-containing protein [Candidatus Micrarchaeia archaeon]|jgi:hypothetical protein
MGWLVRAFAFMLLLSSISLAGRVAVVADTGSSVMAACISYTGTKTAADILHSSGLGVETADFGPGMGEAVCKVAGTGCSASNCFCSSNYWAFYYSDDGNTWTESGTGVSFHDVSDGELLGFSWTGWPPAEPEWRSFSSICSSSSGQAEEPRVIRHFFLNLTNAGNASPETFCMGEPVSVNILSVEDKAPVWEPSFNDAKREVFMGSAVKIFHKDGWWDVFSSGYANKTGFYDFTPLLAGNYSIEVSKSGFVHDYADLEAKDCSLPECTSNSQCEGNAACVQGKCAEVSGACGYADNHNFIEYQCCSDSACSANSRCEDHLCVQRDAHRLSEALRVCFNYYM